MSVGRPVKRVLMTTDTVGGVWTYALELARASLASNYGPLPESLVIANGRALVARQAARKEKLVFSAGRLWDAAKNVAALDAIAHELPWPVYLAGEDENANDLASGANRLGKLSSAQILPWFGKASIYALPARYEPFGLSVLEAALSKGALVLGDIPSLREIWEDAAVFVPPEDTVCLAATLKALIANPAELNELASKARAVADSYSPRAMANGYLAACKWLIARHRNSRGQEAQTSRNIVRKRGDQNLLATAATNSGCVPAHSSFAV